MIQSIFKAACSLAVVTLTSFSATIGNYTWFDANRNGVQDPFEPGFDGAVLRLLTCPGDTLLDVESSTGGGRYEFTGPYASPVAVRVLLPSGFGITTPNAGSNDAADSDVDPASGRTPCIVIDCTNPNGAACIQPGWDVGVVRLGPAPGVRSPGYWKNHLAAWPVDVLTIGGRTYSANEANEWMENGDDKSLTLFRSVVAARLNVLMGNESDCVLETLWHAEQWLEEQPAGSGVDASSAPWKAGEPLHRTLDAYNNGQLCAPKADGNPPSIWFGPRKRGAHHEPIRLHLIGEPGQVFAIQESADLVNWRTIATVTNSAALTEYPLEGVTTHPNRFYRVVVLHSPDQPARVEGPVVVRENDREISLLAARYEGDLEIRGNNNTIVGAGPEDTVITGDLVITGNGNTVRNLTVLGDVRNTGNENALRDVEYRGDLTDTGNGNSY